MTEKNHYGYLWLSDIKQLARKLKKDYPQQNHSQRLNLAAQLHAGVRHYHEAQAIHKKYMKPLQEDQGSNMAKCRYCDFTYCTDLQDDIDWHEERHLMYEKAVRVLGYKPECRLEREDSKEKAYDGMRREVDLTEQIESALKLFRAHFDRSLETAINDGYWKEHPSFEQFIAMMDYSSGLIPEKAMKSIRQKYGRIEGPIPKGLSYWFPCNQN